MSEAEARMSETVVAKREEGNKQILTNQNHYVLVK